jgi:predicted DNA-binding antitoxin AbrB/MazE fold protein
MQVINVKYQDGVFVPVKPVKMTEDQEAVVVISEGKSETKKSAQYYQDKARQHFKENFPDLDVSDLNPPFRTISVVLFGKQPDDFVVIC